MSVYDEYRSKLVTAEEAVKIVKDGDWVDYGFGHTNPYALDKALAARKDELKDIKFRHCLSLRVPEVCKVDPNRETFFFSNWHFSGADRKLHDQGLCNYIPMIFRNKPLFYRKSLNNDVDVSMFRVTPMNKHGYFNLHCGVAAIRATVEVTKKLIVEVNTNPGLPWAMGGREECIHISEVDYVVEAESPIEVIPPATPTDIDKKIAGFIAERIPNGASIQLGIGGLPNMVGTLIAESDLKDLGCHTEMLVDAYYHMYQAGKLTNKNKGIDRGKGVYAFAAGSQFLYDWMDNNPTLATYAVDYTNNPYNIAQNKNQVAINNCIEVDLYGQVNSESAGPRHISGTGGQLDFTTGAYMSEGGQAFIACTSSFKDKQGNLKSRIVPMLPQASIVTVPRTQSHIIVTEYGMADLAGRNTWERAERLINIAHPDLRDELVKEAEKLGIWKKANKI